MARGREPGSNRSRPSTRGRAPQEIGVPVGKSAKTRPIAMPIVKRTYTHCESKNKKGQPCKAPLVKGERFCQGHLNQRAARERSAA